MNDAVQLVLFQVAVGLSLETSKILAALAECEAGDSYCKAEQVVKYLTKILGLSRPAIVIGKFVRNVGDRAWAKLRGRVILQEDQNQWFDSVIGVTIYVAMEYILQPAWTWMGYATECLKNGDCEEKDDIIIWLMNMRIKWCCPDEDNIVVSTKEDDNDGDGDDDVPWCILLVNEAPLILVTLIIWLFYLLSLTLETPPAAQVPDNNGNPPPQPPQPPPDNPPPQPPQPPPDNPPPQPPQPPPDNPPPQVPPPPPPNPPQLPRPPCPRPGRIPHPSRRSTRRR